MASTKVVDSVQAVAVFRAALAALGPGLDASAFRAVAGVLERANDWQQAISIFEVMAARVRASHVVSSVIKISVTIAGSRGSSRSCRLSN